MSDNWTAEPRDSRWYGEVIGSPPGEDITYVSGYSNDEEPDIAALVPDGWDVEEWKMCATPRHPGWLAHGEDGECAGSACVRGRGREDM